MRHWTESVDWVAEAEEYIDMAYSSEIKSTPHELKAASIMDGLLEQLDEIEEDLKWANKKQDDIGTEGWFIGDL